jgi:hypothetical protein
MATSPKIGASALDAQLDYIQTAATQLRLVHTFTRADTHATIVTNTVAMYTIVAEDIFGAITDNTGAPGDTDAPNRRLAVNAQELSAATQQYLGTELALLITDGTEILTAADETSDRAVEVDDVITTWAFYIQASQATLV